MKSAVVAASLVAFLAACGGVPKPETSTAPATVNTGLAALAATGEGRLTIRPGPAIAADDQAALALQAAVDLESLLNSGRLDPTNRARSAPPPPSETAAPFFIPGDLRPADPIAAQPMSMPIHIPLADGDALAEADHAWMTAGVETTPSEPAARNALGNATTDDRLVALASRIASFLREPTLDADAKPAVTEAVILAPIEALSPGSLATIESPASLLGSRLTAQDRMTLAQARDRMASSPLVAADAIAEALRAIAPPPALKVPRTLLCTRVSGFGKFEPFASNTFAAGVAARAIVYVEVEGFTYRAARHGDPMKAGESIADQRAARHGDPMKAGESIADQQAVELEQSITLYQDSDGYQAWHKPAQKVTEVSRTRRRDFYLIQVVELPAALAIGKYNLKVTIRDVTSGSVAETVVPIEIRPPG